MLQFSLQNRREMQAVRHTIAKGLAEAGVRAFQLAVAAGISLPGVVLARLIWNMIAP